MPFASCLSSGRGQGWQQELEKQWPLLMSHGIIAETFVQLLSSEAPTLKDLKFEMIILARTACPGENIHAGILGFVQEF